MSYRPLKGQTALVTGANSGIGLGVGRGDPDGGNRAFAIRADVSHEDQVQPMFFRMLEAPGGSAPRSGPRGD